MNPIAEPFVLSKKFLQNTCLSFEPMNENVQTFIPKMEVYGIIWKIFTNTR